MKIFVSYVNAHKKGDFSEEDFSNQVDRVICSVADHQPLSSVFPVFTHWGRLMTEVAGLEVLCGLSNMGFHSPSLD